MKGFWKAVAFVLAGAIAGIIAADKLQMGVDTVFRGSVKIRQKGRGNVLDTDIKAEVKERSGRAERIINRLEKQKAKAQKKLQKAAERNF